MQVPIIEDRSPTVRRLTYDDKRFYRIEDLELEAIIKDMELSFDEAQSVRDNTYEHDGYYFLPSITWIIGDGVPKDEAFYRWLANQPSYEAATEYRDMRGEYGSKVHWAAEKLMMGETVNYTDTPYGFDEPFTPQDWKAFLSLCNFIEDYRPTIHYVEQTVFYYESHTRTLCAGTADLVCSMPTELASVDNGTKMKGMLTKLRKGEMELSGSTTDVVVDFKISRFVRDEHLIQVSAYGLSLQTTRAAVLLLGSSSKRGYSYNLVKDENAMLRRFGAACVHWRAMNEQPAPRFLDAPMSVSMQDITGDWT